MKKKIDLKNMTILFTRLKFVLEDHVRALLTKKYVMTTYGQYFIWLESRLELSRLRFLSAYEYKQFLADYMAEDYLHGETGGPVTEHPLYREYSNYYNWAKYELVESAELLIWVLEWVKFSERAELRGERPWFSQADCGSPAPVLSEITDMRNALAKDLKIAPCRENEKWWLIVKSEEGRIFKLQAKIDEMQFKLDRAAASENGAAPFFDEVFHLIAALDGQDLSGPVIRASSFNTRGGNIFIKLRRPLSRHETELRKSKACLYTWRSRLKKVVKAQLFDRTSRSKTVSTFGPTPFALDRWSLGPIEPGPQESGFFKEVPTIVVREKLISKDEMAAAGVSENIKRPGYLIHCSYCNK